MVPNYTYLSLHAGYSWYTIRNCIIKKLFDNEREIRHM